MKNLTLFFALFLCLNTFVSAQSDLLVTPFRVVLENGQTTEELSIANIGNDTARYSLSFIQYAMEENGRLRQIEEAEEGIQFSDSFVRFFPRSVVLAPNESQIVRLQARIPSDLAEGEYRSHLYFRSTSPQEAMAFGGDGDDGVGVELIPVYGISIPVIVRKGESDNTVALENEVVTLGENPNIQFDLVRQGSFSCYGDFALIHQEDDGQETLLGTVAGVGVYTPLNARKMNIPLNGFEEILQTGSLKLVYFSKKDGKTEVITEKLIQL
jgi:hypothetical protein